MPTKKKELSEEQAIKLMTRRRNCIQKYRKSYKNKTISFSNPLVQEIPKKRTYKKKTKAAEAVPIIEEPIIQKPIIEEPQPKKKRTYKKKVEAVETLETTVPVIEPKKKRVYKKKTVVEEPTI
jgi:hypothetical protein